jgi:acyl-CoA hydrolase
MGMHVAALIPDGGTLQIGIGALSDAIAQCLILRHRKPGRFGEILASLAPSSALKRHTRPFALGLYACTEMFSDALLELYHAGILKREVDGAVLHAAFFVGPKDFYRALREMPLSERARFRMTSVLYVNQLDGEDTLERRRARRGARFVNSAMMATALGAVVSDGLEDGRVVSGVGGQYNFVAQAFALDDARSILALPATRDRQGRIESNVRWSYGHATIPRHLRDIVVTEYGAADLRGRPDADVIAAMLAITDSQFQEKLAAEAQKVGKIPGSLTIEAKDNTPERIARLVSSARAGGDMPDLPFGSDYTDVEQSLIPALKALRTANTWGLARMFLGGLGQSGTSPHAERALQRLGLERPGNLKEWSLAALVRGALDGVKTKRTPSRSDALKREDE